jgi:hypothetical protein
VAHAKNWRILATRYGGDLGRTDVYFEAAVGLQKLSEEFAG